MRGEDPAWEVGSMFLIRLLSCHDNTMPTRTCDTAQNQSTCTYIYIYVYIYIYIYGRFRRLFAVIKPEVQDVSQQSMTFVCSRRGVAERSVCVIEIKTGGWVYLEWQLDQYIVILIKLMNG